MEYLPIIFKGYSNIFFQENIIFGVLIMIGLAIASPTALLLSLIGNVVGLIMSILLDLKKPIIELGLFGFNGVLIGSMVAFYIKHLPTAILLTMTTSFIAAIIFYLFFKNHIPALAGPFVLVGWALLVLMKVFKF